MQGFPPDWMPSAPRLKIVVSPVRVRVSPSKTALEISAFFVAAARRGGMSRRPKFAATPF
jgi:hypothetical protein